MPAPNSSDLAERGSPNAHRLLPTSTRAGAAVVAGAGVASFAAQWLAVALWVPPAQVPTVWIPGGLMLALALLTAPRGWPAVITAAAAGSTLPLLTLRLVSPTAAVLLGLLTGVHTVALAGLLRHALRGSFALATLRELLIYAVVALVWGAIVGSLLLLTVSWTMHIRPASFVVWRTFALSVALAYLTTTPMVLLLVQEAGVLRRAAARRVLEGALLAFLLVVASGLVFSGAVNRAVTWAGFALALLPLLLWCATRFGPLGTSAALLLVAVISTFSTGRGLGPFASASSGDNTLLLQLFVLGTGLPLLGLAVVSSAEQRTRAALQSSHLRLRGLNRELIAAREEEATRIARELHDDVGQRLALVSIGLSRLQRARAYTSNGHPSDIARLQEQTRSIARSLRQISHELYPAMLEHVGLAAALQIKGEEVTQATGLNVRVVNHVDGVAISPDVALCLFRVAQEAFSNVIRHAGAHRVDLSLRRQGAELMLRIADDGCGFTPVSPDQGPGLGLRSAVERVRSVGGTLTLESEPGVGTTLRVTVPLGGADDAQDAHHPRG